MFPFPHPTHQAGRADLPHPALREDSSRRESSLHVTLPATLENSLGVINSPVLRALRLIVRHAAPAVTQTLLANLLRDSKRIHCRANRATEAVKPHKSCSCLLFLEDRIWNLVLACRSCNCSKSDRVPTEPTPAGLNGRNKNMVLGAHAEDLVGSETAEQDLQVLTADTLEAHVNSLACNCRDEHFGKWDPLSMGSEN